MSRLLGAVFALGLVLAGCSDEGELVSGGQSCRTSATTDMNVKPAVAPPKEAPPTTLTTCDLVAGSGAEAVNGKRVTMQYVGVLWDGGSEFDASWNRGQTFDFVLGRDSVIQGWHEGIAGMKVGGRRELIIPPDKGYGPRGFPPAIPQNATLVFVVDLVAVA